MSLGLTATGSASRTWTATGLPAGLSMNTAGRSPGVPTSPGRVDCPVTVTDTLQQSNSASFLWTVVPPQVVVPDVIRLGLDSAQQVLGGVGLNLGNEMLVYDFTDEPGTVLDQNPSAGQSVPEGSAVNVWVSSLTDGRGHHCTLN